jgi:lipopolysaccharide biosynthesis glycosyltransferase
MFRASVPSTLVLGVLALTSACGRFAGSDPPPWHTLLQGREFLKVLHMAEQRLPFIERADDGYRDLWIARLEAWMHVAPRQAIEAMGEEFARAPLWLGPDDAIYISTVWKQLERFNECYDTLSHALEAWPGNTTVQDAHHDAELELRGRSRWSDCSPPREEVPRGFRCWCY